MALERRCVGLAAPGVPVSTWRSAFGQPQRSACDGTIYGSSGCPVLNSIGWEPKRNQPTAHLWEADKIVFPTSTELVPVLIRTHVKPKCHACAACWDHRGHQQAVGFQPITVRAGRISVVLVFIIPTCSRPGSSLPHLDDSILPRGKHRRLKVIMRDRIRVCAVSQHDREASMDQRGRCCQPSKVKVA